MIHPQWQALMNFTDEHPNCTIKQLHIQDGVPVFLTYDVGVVPIAEIKIKL